MKKVLIVLAIFGALIVSWSGRKAYYKGYQDGYTAARFDRPQPITYRNPFGEKTHGF